MDQLHINFVDTKKSFAKTAKIQVRFGNIQRNRQQKRHEKCFLPSAHRHHQPTRIKGNPTSMLPSHFETARTPLVCGTDRWRWGRSCVHRRPPRRQPDHPRPALHPGREEGRRSVLQEDASGNSPPEDFVFGDVLLLRGREGRAREVVGVHRGELFWVWVRLGGGDGQGGNKEYVWVERSGVGGE